MIFHTEVCFTEKFVGGYAQFVGGYEQQPYYITNGYCTLYKLRWKDDHGWPVCINAEDSHSLFQGTSLAHALGSRKYIWKLPWSDNNLNNLLIRHLKIKNVSLLLWYK
jgi:hypothetical protein